MIKYITQPNQEFEESLVWLDKQNIVAVDTECTGLEPLVDDILLLQIGNHSVQYVYDTYQLEEENIKKILTILTTSPIISVFHNAVYDYSMIKTNYDVEITKLKDTMIANRLLVSGRIGPSAKNDLQTLLNKFFNIPIEKKTRKEFSTMKLGDSFTKEQIHYAGTDVKHLIPLYDKLTEILESRDMGKLAKLEYATVPITADMHLHGIYIDQKKWFTLSKKAEKDMSKAEEILYSMFSSHCEKDMFGDLLVPNTSKAKAKKTPMTPLNLNSTPQLKNLIEIVLGYEIENTEETTLKEIDHKIIKPILEYRKAAKRYSTYGEEFIRQHVGEDGRIHTIFKQLQADSGRYASADPNLQNIPNADEYREPFCVRDPNYKLVCADFSGQELRLLAHISKEPKFIQALKEKKDLHAYSASLIFGIEYEDFFWADPETKAILIDRKGEPIFIDEMKDRYRRPAKELTFGLIYGMGPMKLSQKLKISMKEAKDLRDKYFKIFPEIKNTMDDFTAFVKKNHYALSPLDKRRRDLAQLDWDDQSKVAGAINQAKNLPFQGAGASVTKLAMCKIHRRCREEGLDSKILLTVHDEIILEAHKDVADYVAELVEEEMIKAFNYYAPSVPMEVTAQVSDHWVH